MIDLPDGSESMRTTKQWGRRDLPVSARHRQLPIFDVYLTMTEGLGACFFGIMPEHLGAFRAEFGVPDAYDPIGGITIGHRADDVPAQSARVARRRRAADEVVHRGQWGRHS
ncbi:nitroreductase [Streptomyces noursei]|nr:nitroreductase [Streptomyces noursei]